MIIEAIAALPTATDLKPAAQDSISYFSRTWSLLRSVGDAAKAAVRGNALVRGAAAVVAIAEATLMTLAVKTGSARLVRAMRHLPGLDIATKDIWGKIPLMRAVAADQRDIVKQLIESSHDDIQWEADETTFNHALLGAVNLGNLSLVQNLLADPRADAHVLGCLPLLNIAACRGNTKLFQWLLADPRVGINEQDDEGYTLLDAVIRHGNKEIAQLILADPRVNVNACNACGETSLVVAVKGKRKEMVELLLAAPGVDVNKGDKDDCTPLGWAAYQGSVDMVRLLLSDRRVDANKAETKGNGPLHWAAFQGHQEVVECLLAVPGIDVNRRGEVGISPLAKAYLRERSQVVRALLADPRVELDQPDFEERAPIFFAAAHGDLEAFQALMKGGADIGRWDLQGDFPAKVLATVSPAGYRVVEPMLPRPLQDLVRALGLTKLLAAAFELNGSASVMTSQFQRVFNVERVHPFHALDRMSHDVAEFVTQRQPLKSVLGQMWMEMIGCAANRPIGSQDTADATYFEKFLARIRQGEPTLIPAGFLVHATNVLIWKDLFVIGNRARMKSYGSDEPIKIFRFDPSLLKQEQLNSIKRARRGNQQAYEAMLNDALSKELGFFSDKTTEALEKSCNRYMTMQTVANCGWASVEAGMFAFLAIAAVLMDEKGRALKGNVETADIDRKVKDQYDLFQRWLRFTQVRLLDEAVTFVEKADSASIDRTVVESAFVRTAKWGLLDRKDEEALFHLIQRYTGTLTTKEAKEAFKGRMLADHELYNWVARFYTREAVTAAAA